MQPRDGQEPTTALEVVAAFDIPECHLWRVEDGVAVEPQYFIDSAAMLDALGAPG